MPIFCHVLSSAKRNFKVADIVSCILHPHHNKRYLCHKVPTLISSNMAFIVDTSSLDNFEDICSDDMGTWRNNRVDKSFVSVKISGTNVIKTKQSMKKGAFLVKRVYRVHGTDPSLRKITSSIYGMLYCNYIHV